MSSHHALLELASSLMFSSSRHDLLHVEAHGKNWRAATYEDEEERAENEGWIADIRNAL